VVAGYLISVAMVEVGIVASRRLADGAPEPATLVPLALVAGVVGGLVCGWHGRDRRTGRGAMVAGAALATLLLLVAMAGARGQEVGVWLVVGAGSAGSLGALAGAWLSGRLAARRSRARA